MDVQAGGVIYTTKYDYDISDNLVAITDPRNNTTNYEYDSLNRKIVERYRVGNNEYTRRYDYDALGRLHKITNEKSRSSFTRFDARGLVLQEINPLSQTVTYTYDANGNVKTETDAMGRKISYDYDSLNRTIKMQDSQGNSEEYRYNNQGLLERKRDGRGKWTRYEYDALGRMTMVRQMVGSSDSGADLITRADYDANGNLAYTIDPKGQKTSYQYDELNRLKQLQDARNRVWTFTYDANGNLLTRTTPDNKTTTYTYDGFDRVVKITYPGGPTVSFTYDSNGNRRTMTDANGTTEYSYDEQNRLTSVTDPFANQVSWRYDATGQVDRLTYPGNRHLTYEYDGDDRLQWVRDWLGHNTQYLRDSSGMIEEIRYGNGARVKKSYDAAGRLKTLRNLNGSGGTISSHDFVLDGVGNPTSASLQLPLLPANLGRAAEMIYDASNRMSSIDGTTITHDEDGRLTSDPSGGDPIVYAYNAQDLITRVTKNGVETDSYIYDGDGRRVGRTSGGKTTRYVLDPTGGDLYRLLAEADGNNSVQHYYLYGADGLLAQISGSTHRYYHFDQTGNTLALTNANGTVTDTYAYEPFGNTTVQGSSHNPFRFVGKFGVMDDGNGLHHMRARYYRPDLRRFVSLDALYGQVDDPMTLNRYQYVSGNPMVGVDPSGYCNMFSYCHNIQLDLPYSSPKRANYMAG